MPQKLKKCPACGAYTLNEKCSKCLSETKSAHYKHIKVHSVKQEGEDAK